MEDSKKVTKVTNSKPKAKARPEFLAQSGSIFGSNRLDVPSHYIKEAEEMGCEVRWVSSKILRENHGRHPKGWLAFKFKSQPESGILDPSRFAYGANDSEGVVTVGDMVLAVRPIEICDQHRNDLQEKRNKYKRFATSKRKEYKDFVRDSMGKGASVDEDYDEDNN